MLKKIIMSISCMMLGLPGCRTNVTRYSSVIGLKPEAVDEYERLHADVWPGVIEKLKQGNIRNYSIYLAHMPDGRYYLFSYFEYTGLDFQADMSVVNSDPETKRWIGVIAPMQLPIGERQPGEWMAMDELFYLR